MGSCTSNKYSSKHVPQGEHLFSLGQSTMQTSWMSKFTQQPVNKIIKPYDPNCKDYQYNVEVEGVIFDVIAPPDLLDDDLVMPDMEEE